MAGCARGCASRSGWARNDPHQRKSYHVHKETNMLNASSDRLTRLQAAMRAAGIDVLVVVPGANMRYLAGLEIHMNERIAVAFFPATGTPAMVLPTLETPRAKAQASFPMTF